MENISLQRRSKRDFFYVEAECFRRMRDLHVAKLTLDVVDDWREQWVKHPPPHGYNFDWEDIEDRLDQNGQFGWGFYIGRDLCGLVAGHIRTPSDRTSCLNINNIQRSFARANPFNTGFINCVLDTAEAYAIEEGLETINIRRPSPETDRSYIDRGYSLMRREGLKPYFSKNLG